MSQIRVLHCPTSVGGNPQGLAKMERQLGLDSKSVVFEQNYFQYPTDEILQDQFDNKITIEIKRFKLLCKVLRDYDIVHFNFGKTIFPQEFILEESQNAKQYPKIIQYIYYYWVKQISFKDLLILKKINKGIIVTYQGDDARQGDYCRKNFEVTFANEVSGDYYTAKSDELKRKQISVFAEYADRIYALNPDLLYILPQESQFLPYAHIDLNDWNLAPTHFISPIPTIIHAPSHQEVKGTRFILEAIDRLKSEKIPFEFILVEGLANHEARKIYEKADLLIDQLLAGWYGGLAVELMALGKPVICYIRQEDLKFIPLEMKQDLPIIQATPTTIYKILKTYLTTDKNKLVELGIQSRAYVEKWHDPYKITSFLKREYEAIMKSKEHK